MTAGLVKEPLRHILLVNALDGPLDSRKSDRIRGHIFQGNPGVTSNGSKTVSTGLGPKTFNHAGVLPTLDMGLSKICPSRSDICGLHLGVIVDEG